MWCTITISQKVENFPCDTGLEKQHHALNRIATGLSSALTLKLWSHEATTFSWLNNYCPTLDFSCCILSWQLTSDKEVTHLQLDYDLIWIARILHHKSYDHPKTNQKVIQDPISLSRETIVASCDGSFGWLLWKNADNAFMIGHSVSIIWCSRNNHHI